MSRQLVRLVGSGARAVALFVALLTPLPGLASALCPAEQDAPLLPKDPALCASLERVVRDPSALPLDQYEAKLGDYLRAFCHRNAASGWKRDKEVRDTGPFTATLVDGKWAGAYHGTHAPVVIWYSPEAYAWLKANRPEDGPAPSTVAPMPDGAMLIKEMVPPPGAACRGVEPTRLLPLHGAAVMVRDSEASHDGWFWGWFGWSDWSPDWPATTGNGYPDMGFGQYCTNCHASAKDTSIFAALRNIEGEPGTPLSFLSQHWFLTQSDQVRQSFAPIGTHKAVPTESDDVTPEGAAALDAANPAIAALAGLMRLPADRSAVPQMPSQTYDNVWVGAGGATAAHQFVTSDQCVGCHSAGGTGLQFDMTEPGPGGKLWNVSPYGTWRATPMGLAGRDPIFFAQLASEMDSFHPKSRDLVQDTCLGCHGIMGERQFKIDRTAAGRGCETFGREMVAATPWPTDAASAGLAKYGALARDGISCMACHRMVMGEADTAKYKDAPQNACMAERRARLSPQNSGFARTFTGSFLVGPPDALFGPFKDPKQKPMQHALGIKPEHNAHIQSSELCGACHTVHLPVLRDGEVVGYAYEQSTYPEWAFSAYRTGDSPDGPLPSGKGERAQSCQDCHMPSTDAAGKPYRSKIAGIQELSNFPTAENTLPAADIDLPVRDGFSKHVLVGLNVFLVKMAQQFPDLLGIRTQDPMLVSKGVDSLQFTEKAMLDQAAKATAAISVPRVAIEGGALKAAVRIENKTGHKFPSGVGFRRAFVEFKVLDDAGAVLWASGRTDPAGKIVDAAGRPLAGELWWEDDCSARRDPLAHQPHYRVISRQDQAQIYQELVSTPPAEGPAQCGPHSKPAGQLTTSFLSICSIVKDNRLLPHGLLPLDERKAIAAALGAGPEMAEEAGPFAVGDDPDYAAGSGTDEVLYAVNLTDLAGKPAAVQATLYWQATPPFYLQDRFCTSKSEDTARLGFIASRLNLEGGKAAGWKLETVTTGAVPLPN